MWFDLPILFCIALMGDDDWRTRECATKTAIVLNDAFDFRRALKAALKKEVDPERRRRIKEVLEAYASLAQGPWPYLPRIEFFQLANDSQVSYWEIQGYFQELGKNLYDAPYYANAEDVYEDDRLRREATKTFIWVNLHHELERGEVAEMIERAIKLEKKMGRLPVEKP